MYLWLMGESALVIVSFLCLIIGFFGSFLPILPGTMLSWLGLLLFKFTSYADYGWPTLIVLGLIVVIYQLLDYFLPIYGSKKLGGSKYGMIGASVGLLVGLIFSPFGLISVIVMPFLGAFLGEFLIQRQHHKKALKSAFGTFVGFMLSTGIGMFITLMFLGFAIWQFTKGIA